MAKGIVKTMIDHKREIKVRGELFRWNSAYRVYNSEKDNRQLTWADLGVKEVSPTRAVSVPRRKKKHTPALVRCP